MPTRKELKAVNDLFDEIIALGQDIAIGEKIEPSQLDELRIIFKKFGKTLGLFYKQDLGIFDSRDDGFQMIEPNLSNLSFLYVSLKYAYFLLCGITLNRGFRHDFYSDYHTLYSNTPHYIWLFQPLHHFKEYFDYFEEYTQRSPQRPVYATEFLNFLRKYSDNERALQLGLAPEMDVLGIIEYIELIYTFKYKLLLSVYYFLKHKNFPDEIIHNIFKLSCFNIFDKIYAIYEINDLEINHIIKSEAKNNLKKHYNIRFTNTSNISTFLIDFGNFLISEEVRFFKTERLISSYLNKEYQITILSYLIEIRSYAILLFFKDSFNPLFKISCPETLRSCDSDTYLIVMIMEASYVFCNAFSFCLAGWDKVEKPLKLMANNKSRFSNLKSSFLNLILNKKLSSTDKTLQQIILKASYSSSNDIKGLMNNIKIHLKDLIAEYSTPEQLELFNFSKIMSKHCKLILKKYTQLIKDDDVLLKRIAYLIFDDAYTKEVLTLEKILKENNVEDLDIMDIILGYANPFDITKRNTD